MARDVTFGVVGGYGATGRMVASELCKSSDGEILIGGRDLKKNTALAAELDSRVSAAHLEIFDAHSLDDFCGRCSIIVNCAGPVMELQDRVAQTAFRRKCHYIDAAGMSLVKERLLPLGPEIEDAGLSFVVSAGWNPGLTELLPVYAHARAKAQMDAIESLTVFLGDSGEWSTNALRDGVWFIRETGLRSPGYFRKGQWKRARLSEASRSVNLSDPIGPGRFAMFFLPELAEVGRELSDIDVFSYAYLSGYRTVIATTLMALVPLPKAFGVRLLRNVFRRNRGQVEGFVVTQIRGRSQGRGLGLTAQIVYGEGRGYWLNAAALATVARMVESRTIRTGVHFLADAVDPNVFMAKLRKAGFELTEKFEAYE